MKKTASKEIKIELPGDLVEIVSRKEIITMLLDKALSKAEYLGSRCREFEEKYTAERNYEMLVEIYQFALERAKRNK
jgi:hypothetical protein